MNEQAARAQVIRAGLELVESGLIARTWGNVSCRVDENTFVVTPSGRAYETLAPAQIVSCRIADASWEGDVKPSSEKGIHALVYRMRPDVNFVIHTHQSMASAVGAAGLAVMPPMGEPLLGEGVPVAAYGLPGTKKLRKGVGAALGGCTGKAVLMAHHGALCIGSNYDEAFAAARRLEEASEKFIEAEYLKKSGAETFDEARMLRFYLSLVARGSAPELPGKAPALYSSVRSPGGFELIEDSGRRTQHLFGDAGLSPQAQIHRQIYLRRGDVNFICQASGSGLTAVSLTGRPMAPLLDDFAQIVGPGAQCAKSLRPEDVADSLGSRFAVLVPGAGALCCAATDSDENAVRLVMEKAALVETGSRIVGRPRPIRFPECLLMHFIYMKSYSKMAK